MKLLARIMSAIGTALRRSFIRLANGVLVPVFTWTTSFLDGLFHRGAIETTEVVEDIVGEMAIAEQSRALINEEPALPKASLADIAKRACACRDQQTSYRGLLNESDPSHQAIGRWVDGLDETGLRTVRHMPIQTLSRHLDAKDAFTAHGGLPKLGSTPVPLSGRQAFEARRRPDSNRTANELVEIALKEGRLPTLDDLVDVETTYRRAARF